MAKLNFGGVEETVVTREEFTLDHAREVLKDETIAVIGYGVQGPGQSLNLKDNGFMSSSDSVRERPSRRLSQTAGFQARLSSESKRPARRLPSSCASFRMLL